MSERDYFDLPDDERAEPEQTAVLPQKPIQSVQTVESYDDPGMPVASRHIGKSIVAVIIFLFILGGCAFMIWHQIHEDLKPHKPAAQTSQQK